MSKFHTALLTNEEKRSVFGSSHGASESLHPKRHQLYKILLEERFASNGGMVAVFVMRLRVEGGRMFCMRTNGKKSTSGTTTSGYNTSEFR